MGLRSFGLLPQRPKGPEQTRLTELTAPHDDNVRFDVHYVGIAPRLLKLQVQIRRARFAVFGEVFCHGKKTIDGSRGV
jgi:hypothetical protein